MKRPGSDDPVHCRTQSLRLQQIILIRQLFLAASPAVKMSIFSVHGDKYAQCNGPI